MKQKYDNDPEPHYFACGNFEYENEASKKYNEESDKAVFEYHHMSQGISPFDPIPIPPLANVPGNNFPRELFITKERLERFTHLSCLALADYNTKNQLANDNEYEFAELVKAVSKRIPLGTYYITFNAKPKDSTSNCSATTFQAHVVQSVKGT
ncbi:hypothetical protein A2U01_0029423, partial [Trifolium medium]|nr:hypothetical protein [Trifolium medium]